MEAKKAEVIDIPFAKWEPPKDEGCRVVKSDGTRCGKPVWQEGMCGVHREWEMTMSAAMGLPFPEDQLSMHRFLLRALDLVVSGKISERRLRAMETLCRMIVRNARVGRYEV